MTWSNQELEWVVKDMLRVRDPLHYRAVKPSGLTNMCASETASPWSPGFDTVDGLGLILELLQRWKDSNEEIKALKEELRAHILKDLHACIAQVLKTKQTEALPEGAIIN